MQATQFHTELAAQPDASIVCGAPANCASDSSQGIELAPTLKYLLYKWFYRRFQQRCPTTELINGCDNAQDKTVIAIIAMLDVDTESLKIGLSVQEWHFVEACHRYLQGLEWAH